MASDFKNCAFCGAKRSDDPSEAHTWPRRYSRWALRSQPPGTKFYSRDSINEAPLPNRVTHLINVKTKHGPVCGRCNSGWMNEIEERAWPVLLRLMRSTGTPTERLDQTSQTLLASWAVLFAMVYELATVPHDPLITWQQRHWFRRTHLPSRRNVAVWIGAYVGASPSRAFRPPLINLSDRRLSIVEANVTTFTIGQVAFQVLVNRWMKHMSWGKPGIPTPASRWASAESRIWPHVGEIAWPSKERLDDAWLEEWSKRWASLPPKI